LPAKAQADFDYIEGEDRFSPRMVLYKGTWYDVNEFFTTSTILHGELADLAAWDAYQSDSYFSGVLLRWARDWSTGRPDFEAVVMGNYYS